MIGNICHFCFGCITVYNSPQSNNDIPVIASGGMGTINDGIKAVQESNVDAVAIASILHYKKESIPEIRKIFKKSGVNVRDYNVKN